MLLDQKILIVLGLSVCVCLFANFDIVTSIVQDTLSTISLHIPCVKHFQMTTDDIDCVTLDDTASGIHVPQTHSVCVFFFA